MAAASTAIIGATLCGAPWPITRLSTSIMKSGVARPSRLMSSDARASLAMTGRTRAQSGAYHSAARSRASFSRNTRARAPSVRMSADVICQTRPSTTSSTVHCPPRPAATTCAGSSPPTTANGVGSSSRRAVARSTALACRPSRVACGQEARLVERLVGQRRQPAHIGFAERPADLLDDVEQRPHQGIDGARLGQALRRLSCLPEGPSEV